MKRLGLILFAGPLVTGYLVVTALSHLFGVAEVELTDDWSDYEEQERLFAERWDDPASYFGNLLK